MSYDRPRHAHPSPPTSAKIKHTDEVHANKSHKRTKRCRSTTKYDSGSDATTGQREGDVYRPSPSATSPEIQPRRQYHTISRHVEEPQAHRRPRTPTLPPLRKGPQTPPFPPTTVLQNEEPPRLRLDELPEPSLPFATMQPNASSSSKTPIELFPPSVSNDSSSTPFTSHSSQPTLDPDRLTHSESNSRFRTNPHNKKPRSAMHALQSHLSLPVPFFSASKQPSEEPPPSLELRIAGIANLQSSSSTEGKSGSPTHADSKGESTQERLKHRLVNELASSTPKSTAQPLSLKEKLEQRVAKEKEDATRRDAVQARIEAMRTELPAEVGFPPIEEGPDMAAVRRMTLLQRLLSARRRSTS